MKKIFNWIIDKWLAGFLTALFLFFIKLYAELPEEERSNFFDFNWLRSILSVEIKLWKILITIIIVLFAILIRRKIKSQEKDDFSYINKQPNDPRLHYRIDTFGVDNAKWTWDYNWDPFDEKIIVKDVLPICPSCGAKMDFVSYIPNGAECAKCRLDGKKYDYRLRQYRNDVMKEILRRLNTGEWEKAKQ